MVYCILISSRLPIKLAHCRIINNPQRAMLSIHFGTKLFHTKYIEKHRTTPPPIEWRQPYCGVFWTWRIWHDLLYSDLRYGNIIVIITWWRCESDVRLWSHFLRTVSSVARFKKLMENKCMYSTQFRYPEKKIRTKQYLCLHAKKNKWSFLQLPLFYWTLFVFSFEWRWFHLCRLVKMSWEMR